MRTRYDTVAVVAEGGIRAPEGTEDGRGGRDLVSLGRQLMFNFVNEPARVLDCPSDVEARRRRGKLCSRFEAEHVGDPLPLIPLRITDLAHGIEKADTHHPFICGELDLSGKVVDVLDEATQNLPRSRAGLRPHGIDDVLGEVRVEP